MPRSCGREARGHSPAFASPSTFSTPGLSLGFLDFVFFLDVQRGLHHGDELHLERRLLRW